VGTFSTSDCFLEQLARNKRITYMKRAFFT
jgi:hypothetical protein